MHAWRRFAAVAMAAALGACTTLGAERPLFAVSDQRAAPIEEGVWIAISEDCPEHQLRNRSRYPDDCSPVEIRRAEDGAWLATLRADLIYGLSADEREQAEQQDGPRRSIIAPAVERALDDATFAPLYVAESQPAELERERVGYMVIAPVGVLPASEMRVLVVIACDDIVRDGPIDGVTLSYRTFTPEGGTETQEISGCTASSQAAVREAARRMVIENLEELAGTRFVRARP